MITRELICKKYKHFIENLYFPNFKFGKHLQDLSSLFSLPKLYFHFHFQFQISIYFQSFSTLFQIFF